MKGVYIKLLFLLLANTANGEVFGNFNFCLNYFYQRVVPTGIPSPSNSKFICQLYVRTSGYQYATLYNMDTKTPTYSAYTIPNGHVDCEPMKRPTKWYIEPQLADINIKTMASENDATQRLQVNRLKLSASQAINSNYAKSGYDKGHLNPNFHQCSANSRRAGTFTLTNAVPMVPHFNQRIWYEAEKDIRDLAARCNVPRTKFHVITGVVPSGTTTPKGNIDIPTHVWSAVCCDASLADSSNSFFVGFLGGNDATTGVETYTDEDVFSTQLAIHYGTIWPTIRLFGSNGCKDRDSDSSVCRNAAWFEKHEPRRKRDTNCLTCNGPVITSVSSAFVVVTIEFISSMVVTMATIAMMM